MKGSNPIAPFMCSQENPFFRGPLIPGAQRKVLGQLIQVPRRHCCLLAIFLESFGTCCFFQCTGVIYILYIFIHIYLYIHIYNLSPLSVGGLSSQPHPCGLWQSQNISPQAAESQVTFPKCSSCKPMTERLLL